MLFLSPITFFLLQPLQKALHRTSFSYPFPTLQRLVLSILIAPHFLRLACCRLYCMSVQTGDADVGASALNRVAAELLQEALDTVMVRWPQHPPHNNQRHPLTTPSRLQHHTRRLKLSMHLADVWRKSNHQRSQFFPTFPTTPIPLVT